MKQVVQHLRSSKTALTDVPPPSLSKGEVLVATEASLISAGTEKMLIEFAGKTLAGKAAERPDLVGKMVDKLQKDGLFSTMNAAFAQLEQPLPLGYSAAGRVLAVSPELQNQFKIGDRVAIAGAGIANHAEINAVPKHLVAHMPEGLTFEQASFATLATVALHGVRSADVSVGESVLVMGLGLVGQLVSQIAKASGARVFAVDYDQNRLATAKECGADEIYNLEEKHLDDKANHFTGGKGFDRVIVCAATDSSRPLEQAAHLARDRANIVLVGKTGTTIPHKEFMKKELNFVISRSYGPGRYDASYEKDGHDYPKGYVRWTEHENMSEVLRLMRTGALNLAPLTTHTYPIDEAEEAYSVVTNKNVPQLGVVLTYGRSDSARTASSVTLQPTATGTETVGLGVIGSGAFARSVMLPRFKCMKDVSLTGILSKGGLSAQAAGKRFKFSYATSKIEDVLGDAETQAVYIASRHDSHADLTVKALKAGKHVLVEKPLAMNAEEFMAVQECAAESGKMLMVGYNRRFSAYAEALRDTFNPVTGAKQVMIRVNAGHLDAQSWQHDPAIGGGRLLGEICHFIDLAIYLVGHKVERVHSVRGAGQDNYSIILTFTDGSLATIIYSSEGDVKLPKERVEIFGGHMAGVIDNFKRGMLVRDGKKRRIRKNSGWKGYLLTGGDKGHSAELRSFIDAVKGDSAPPVTLEEVMHSTAVTLAAVESLKAGTEIKL